MKSCSDPPEQVVVQRHSVNVSYPSPLDIYSQVTFKFSYCFVVKLVTKVLISCLLEVLTSKHCFC